MLKQKISVGDLVEYHGSMEQHHGKHYVVAAVPVLPLDYADNLINFDPERGYLLVPPDGNWSMSLRNAHRNSITLLVAQYKAEAKI